MRNVYLTIYAQFSARMCVCVYIHTRNAYARTKAKIGVSLKSGGCQIRVIVGRVYFTDECLKFSTRSIERTSLFNFLRQRSFRDTIRTVHDTKLKTINDIYAR